MEFKKLRIKALSKQAISKLKRGLPARIMKGEGMQLVLMPHQYDAVSRSFLKSKGMNLILSPPEVQANTVSEIGGEGIFGKKADKWMEKKGIKKFVYDVGSAVKPLAMEAIDAAAMAATAYGVPAPIVALAQKETKGYIDKPQDYQTKKGQMALLGRVGRTAEEVASPYLAEAGIDMQQVRDARKLASDMKKMSKMSKSAPSMSTEDLREDAEEAFLSTLQAYMDRRQASAAPKSTNPMDLMDEDGIIGNGFIQDIRKSLRRPLGGMGLYAGAPSGRGIGTGFYSGGSCCDCMCGKGFKSQLKDVSKKFVNQSRSIIGTGHAALESQNLDANFLMSNQYPPSYQRRR